MDEVTRKTARPCLSGVIWAEHVRMSSNFIELDGTDRHGNPAFVVLPGIAPRVPMGFPILARVDNSMEGPSLLLFGGDGRIFDIQLPVPPGTPHIHVRIEGRPGCLGVLMVDPPLRKGVWQRLDRAEPWFPTKLREHGFIYEAEMAEIDHELTPLYKDPNFAGLWLAPVQTVKPWGHAGTALELTVPAGLDTMLGVLPFQLNHQLYVLKGEGLLCLTPSDKPHGFSPPFWFRDPDLFATIPFEQAGPRLQPLLNWLTSRAARCHGKIDAWRFTVLEPPPDEVMALLHKDPPAGSVLERRLPHI